MKNPMQMKRLLAVVACVSAVGCFLYFKSNPLRKYGVYYGFNPGGSETFTHIQFYRSRNGETIKGPQITGSLLDVTYQDFNDDGVPEIVVKSSVNKTHKATLRLNLSNANEPDFDVLENNYLMIDYPLRGLHWP